MITTPEIICDLFSFLDKDQIERIQLVSQFWNDVIICHKNILPLRQFYYLVYNSYLICLYETEEDYNIARDLDKIRIYWTSLNEETYSKMRNVSPRYPQLTVVEVLENLKDVIFYHIEIDYRHSEDRLDYFLNMMKLVTMRSGGRFRGKFGNCHVRRFDSTLDEIFDNYIIVNELTLNIWNDDSYIREVCANPEIVQLPHTPKAIKLNYLKFKDNEEVLHFACNGKLNGANRLTIELETWDTNYGNFIRQWFKLYRTHENLISLVRKFKLTSKYNLSVDSGLDGVKTFLNNTQLCVKYSLDLKECSHPERHYTNHRYKLLKRSCVLHEADSYALVIKMKYVVEADMSSINASDLDQPPCDKICSISIGVKSL